MKLDKRIIEGKKPLTCFDTEEAKQFIGKECYFCDCPLAFGDLDKFTTLVKGNLYRVQDTEKPFLIDKIACSRYAYCIPCEWVKEKDPEPEWKPYLIDEWLQEHNFGDMIEFRTKTNHVEITAMFIGLDSGPQNGETRIMLGCNAYSFDSLFEHYELIDKTNDGKFVWRPFGIEVKE